VFLELNLINAIFDFFDFLKYFLRIYFATNLNPFTSWVLTKQLARSMKYAPITSIDVEHLFFMYKRILSNNNVSFTIENLVKYMFIKLNFQLFLFNFIPIV